MRTLVLEYWTPLLVWLFAIIIFSSDSFSIGQTSRFIVPLLTFFFPGLSPHQIEVWHGVIRKLAHVAEYFILAVLAFRACKLDTPLPAASVRAGMLVLITALVDEFHQGFTASRGASILDVGYDCLGAVWALCLITMYENRRIRSYSLL